MKSIGCLVAVSPSDVVCRQMGEAVLVMGVGTGLASPHSQPRARAPARYPSRECGSRTLTAVTGPGQLMPGPVAWCDGHTPRCAKTDKPRALAPRQRWWRRESYRV